MLRVLSTASTLLVGLLACGGDPTGDPTQGSIKAQVTSSGSPADPDGFFLTIDPNTGTPITVVYEATGGTQTFTGVTAGSHVVELFDVASNCTVNPSALRSVAVIAGQTVSVLFTVTCSAAG
jgi:hypothetical protein